MQITAPTAAQGYVEVNDMKHYSTVRWRLEHLRDVLTGAKMGGVGE